MKPGEHKDYFSTQANAYAAFRPTYPAALYEFIFRHLTEKRAAWDCATGNGQVARYLADHFEKVYATDISRQQLDQATQKKNIIYSLSPAEKTPFPDNQFDLTTVGQALHWFDRDRFYEEINRVSKPGSLLAVWGYGLLYIDPAIDKVIMDFYNNTVGPYWDGARKLVEEKYRTLSFPFEEIHTPEFSINVEWTIDHLAGYLSSWSSTQKYMNAKGHDPVPSLIERLSQDWGPPKRKVGTFPIFSRIGKITK